MRSFLRSTQQGSSRLPRVIVGAAALLILVGLVFGGEGKVRKPIVPKKEDFATWGAASKSKRGDHWDAPPPVGKGKSTAKGSNSGTTSVPASASPSFTWHNQWPLHVRAVHANELDLTEVPDVELAFSGTKPPYVLSPSLPSYVESWQMLLTKRILANHKEMIDNASFVAIDVGCNTGTYASFWATLGFHAYCVDAEIFGGASGIGTFDFPGLKNADPIVRERITFFPMGVTEKSTKYLSYKGSGHNFQPVASLSDVQGLAVPTATYKDLLGRLPSSFLTKIDIDGGEISALNAILEAIDEGRMISNIIVELTPMWWPTYGFSFDQGWQVIERLLQTHSVYVSFWREASQVCCQDIFATPETLDWNADFPLGFVQEIDPKKLRGYLAQMVPSDRKHGQRDFWFRERAQPKLEGLENGVHLKPLVCEDVSLYADPFKPEMPCGRHHESG